MYWGEVPCGSYLRAHPPNTNMPKATANHRPPLSGYAMRQKLAAGCKSLLEEVAPKKLSFDLTRGFSQRMIDTLQLLLPGDSEKEVATKLNLSPHTVHIHVKKLYKRLDVSSR